MSGEVDFVRLEFEHLDEYEMLARARAMLAQMSRRRTTRDFSTRAVPRELIELAIATAGTAPSGAHLQPWTFVAVGDPDLKRAMRDAAEAEEERNYSERMSEPWLEVLAPLGTDAIKAHITDAPWVVVLFKQTRRVRPDGGTAPTYYATESVGIAAGMFIAAVHNMGLATLTHTPSPMGFLRELLGRPDRETPLLLMPVGYPAEEAMVPDIERKPLVEISEFL